MNTNNPGYVYILTNPSFREDWIKIGKSTRPVDVRASELDKSLYSPGRLNVSISKSDYVMLNLRTLTLLLKRTCPRIGLQNV